LDSNTKISDIDIYKLLTSVTFLLSANFASRVCP